MDNATQQTIKSPKGSTNTNPSDISFFEIVHEDFIIHDSDFFSQGFWALFNQRFGNWRMDIKPKLLRFPFTLLYRIHRRMVQIICGIKLDYTVQVGRRVKLEHFGGMIIGATRIGNDVILRQNTTLGIKTLDNLDGKPTLEDGVMVGAGAVIVGDITIGKGTIIGANAVVFDDVPPHSKVYPGKSTIITPKEKTKAS